MENNIKTNNFLYEDKIISNKNKKIYNPEREISILKRLNHINVIKIYKITEELEKRRR